MDFMCFNVSFGFLCIIGFRLCTYKLYKPWSNTKLVIKLRLSFYHISLMVFINFWSSIHLTVYLWTVRCFLYIWRILFFSHCNCLVFSKSNSKSVKIRILFLLVSNYKRMTQILLTAKILCILLNNQFHDFDIYIRTNIFNCFKCDTNL